MASKPLAIGRAGCAIRRSFFSHIPIIYGILSDDNILHLTQADATNIPFNDNEFDKVVGLECAFHFSTRADFLKESYRVLKCEGHLVLSDFIARSNINKTIWTRVASFLGRRSWQIPKNNMYCSKDYKIILEQIGYKDIDIEVINEHVFDQFTAYQRSRFDNENFKKRYNPLVRWAAKKQIDWGFLNTLDYVVVTARK